MEKTNYGGWPNCIQLGNKRMELVVTTDVGPRIIRLAFRGGPNLLKEYPQHMGKQGGNSWRIYGGHRLWHAPEAKPRTYWPDNGPVAAAWSGKTLKLIQTVEKTTGIQKEIEITVSAGQEHVHLVHRLINRNPWAIELAPWALTVMAQRGRVIFPHEPYRPHPDYLLPARPLVLWHYTDMQDPRWTWGTKYIQLQQDPDARTKQKVGFLNAQGWGAYELDGCLFVKRYACVPGATYPDCGCNTETYTAPDMLEFETLGPVTRLAEDGGSVEHVEDWFLFRGTAGHTDDEIDRNLLPLIRKTVPQVKKK
jgi:hypothetical protein